MIDGKSENEMACNTVLTDRQVDHLAAQRFKPEMAEVVLIINRYHNLIFPLEFLQEIIML